MNAEPRRMPRCLGIYQPNDSQCDGETHGKTEQDRMPCVFRDRCVAFQRFLNKKGKEPKAYLDFKEVEGDPGRVYSYAKDPERLERIISRQIARFGIRNGRVTRRNAPATIVKPKPRVISPETMAKLRANKPPSRSALRLGSKVRSKQLAEARENVTELAQWFTKQLTEKSGRPIRDSQALAAAGEFFLIDRSETSRYVAVYSKRSNGSKQPVASMYFRPSQELLELRLAVDCAMYSKSLNKVASEKLTVEDFTGKDGAFKVRLRQIDMEKAAIVAESIAIGINRGIFDLPEIE